MPQVPYTPYPTVSPSEQNTPEFRPQVVPGAFGAGLGQAISHLGSQLEHSGDEIFRAAVQLRKEQIEAEVNTATTQYMENTAKAREAFLLREGTAAGPEALNGFMGSIRGDREAMRATLGSPYAQRMFDNQTRVEMSRAFTSGLVHSAGQIKKVHRDAEDALLRSFEAGMQSNPSDRAAFDDYLRRGSELIRKRARETGQLEGVGETNVQTWAQEQKARQVIGLADSKPDVAKKLAEEYEGELGANTAKVNEIVHHKIGNMIATGVAEDATAHMFQADWDWNKSKPLSEIQVEVREKTLELTGGNKEAAQYAVQRAVGIYNSRMAGVRNQQLIDKENVHSLVLGYKQPGGKLPTTIEEIYKVEPQAKAWFERMGAAGQQSVLRALSKNAKGDQQWTNDGIKEWQRLDGMSQDPQQAGEFLDENILDKDGIPLSQRLALIHRQGKVRVKPDSFPGLDRAMKQLTTLRRSLTADRDQSATKYNQFRGLLYRALLDFQQTNKKPPGPEDVAQIGQDITMELNEPTFWNKDAKARTYQRVPTKQERNAIREDLRLNKLPIPPDDVLLEDFRLGLYKNIIEGRQKPKQDAGK